MKTTCGCTVRVGYIGKPTNKKQFPLEIELLGPQSQKVYQEFYWLDEDTFAQLNLI